MNHTRIKIFTCLSVLLMIGIFIFSSRDAEKSTKDSHEVGEAVAEVIIEDFDELPAKEKENFVESIDHFVRKSAHFIEYMTLGFLLMNAGLGFRKNRFLTAFISLSVGSLYAATDEFHQRFVPGRAGMVSDWLLDSSGVLTGVAGVLICSLLFGLVIKAMKKNEKKYVNVSEVK